MSQDLRIVDQRVRMQLKGTETSRAVVASVSGRTATVRTGDSLLPAIIPALPVPLKAGAVVELERPRGVGGELHIVRVLGQSGPAATAAVVEEARGTVIVVTELPTASAAYRGRTVLLEASGVVDAFWRVRRKADGTWEWAPG